MILGKRFLLVQQPLWYESQKINFVLSTHTFCAVCISVHDSVSSMKDRRLFFFFSGRVEFPSNATLNSNPEKWAVFLCDGIFCVYLPDCIPSSFQNKAVMLKSKLLSTMGWVGVGVGVMKFKCCRIMHPILFVSW